MDEVRWGSRKHFLLFKSRPAVYHTYKRERGSLFEVEPLSSGERKGQRDRVRKTGLERQGARETERDKAIIETLTVTNNICHRCRVDVLDRPLGRQ